MSQPDRRSLLIGACRKRQDQIRHKLAQVRQRLQITDGLDNERWAQVERDLLGRFDQEEERVQRLLNESQETLAAPHSHEASTASAEPVERPEPGRSALLILQQNYKKAQLLLAQKNEQIARLQKEIESKPGEPANPDAELLVKEQTIAKLRQHNQALTAQVAKLKAEVIDEEELDELHRQNEALSAALEERDRVAAGLRAEIGRLQTPSSADQEELEELHRQNASLSNELAYRDENEAELRAEIMRLQEAPPGNEQELEDLQRQNEYLNQELSLRDQSEARLRGEIARLQAVERVTGELRDQNAVLASEVNEQTESLLRVQTEFEGRIVELTHQNEALRADLDLKTEVTGRVQFDLELKTGEFDRLSREHQLRGAQLEELQRQVDDLVKEATADAPASQAAAHHQELLEQLTQQAEKHEQELARQTEPLRAQIADLLQQLKEALQSQPASNEGELRAQITELQQQLEQAQTAPSNEAELRAEIADLKQQLNQARLSNDAELQSEIADLRQQLEHAQATAPSRESELQTEIADLRQQLEQTQAIASSSEAELQTEIADLKQQLEQAQTALPSNEGELQAQIAELQQQLEQAQATAPAGGSELQAEIADLRQQLEQTQAIASSSEAELQTEIADLRQQLEQAQTAPPSSQSELLAEMADLRQQLEQALQSPPFNEADLQTEIAALRQQILDVQPELERLREQARQSQALVPPEDPEKQQLQARVSQLEEQLASGGDPAELQQLKDKLALQADKFQLELELLRSAHKVVDTELAKLLEAPLGAAPPAAPRTNTSGYLGGDPSPEESGYLGAAPASPPPPRAPIRPVTPVAKSSGWLGSPDEEPWDGYVRPNYSKAGLPPGAAGAAKLAARSANLGVGSSIEEAAKADLPPLELSEASQEEADNWLAGPETAESDELPDWLTAEKPTE